MMHARLAGSRPVASLLWLDEADVPGIGGKARTLSRLSRLRPALFCVPRGLVVGAPFDLVEQRPLLSARLDRLGSGPYAVRSCGLAEDGDRSSLAGKYRTELNVPREHIQPAIEWVRESYESHGDTGVVLIQRMVGEGLAGVLFTRSPANAGLATCEFVEGVGHAVVSGNVQPRTAHYGRWSGRIEHDHDSARAGILERVFCAGMVIEEAWGAPQDIEWAWESRTDRIVILQLRPITATSQSRFVAGEQARLARMALATRHGRRGRPFLRRSAVAEVVSDPTPLTRSLIERMYATGGALGQAFGRLGLPRPRTDRPYVLSAFGQLYRDVETESRLFRTGPRKWWATRRLDRRLRTERDRLLSEVAAMIDQAGDPGGSIVEPGAEVPVKARRILELVDRFLTRVYPPAHVAALLAQRSREDPAGATCSSRLFRDLSRLHHTGELTEFLHRWGHRSANDYELAEPRFAEDPERAIDYATRFAGVAWDDPSAPPPGFTQIKELAKDRAMRWLAPLRRSLLDLERQLGLSRGDVFQLGFDEIEAIASGAVAPTRVLETIAERRKQALDWAAIDLGEAPTLERIERLTGETDDTAVLRGRMVAAPVGFRGRVRTVSADGRCDDGRSTHPDGEVLVTPFLRPELVGRFAATTGCVADVGGALSHAAIVAREMGYPVVVLPGSSTTFKDGDLVEVSANGAVAIRRDRPAVSGDALRLERLGRSSV